MFISHYSICELLKDQQAVCKVEAPDYCLTGFESIRTALLPMSLHTLYVVEDPEDLEHMAADSDERIRDALSESVNLLICRATLEQAASLLGDMEPLLNYTVLPSPLDTSVKLLLREYFNEKNGMGLMAESILDMLFHETGIQPIVDKFTRGFNNPVFVFDAGYHLIACNYEMAVQDPAGKRIVEQMGMTEDEFRLINKRRIHEKVRKSDQPVTIYHDEIGCEQMICAIDTRKDIGHIVINAVNRPFNDMDVQLMIMLKEGLYQQMRKEEFVKDNNGFPYEYFLKDLLDGKIATPKQYLAQLNYVNAEFSESMYCLVIETARSTATLNVFLIRNRFESLLPNTKTLMYNGEIIVLFCLKKQAELSPEDYQSIRELCIQHGLFAGISNNFTSLLDLAGYYKQAIRAIEIGTVSDPVPGLYIYNQYFMEHMAHIFFQKESPDVFCHPKMKYLLDYDKAHDSQLAYSLYMYLLHERNSAAAAEAMFVHRNTLSYRLSKIDSLIHIDYNNSLERQYLILSYEVQNEPR